MSGLRIKGWPLLPPVQAEQKLSLSLGTRRDRLDESHKLDFLPGNALFIPTSFAGVEGAFPFAAVFAGMMICAGNVDSNSSRGRSNGGGERVPNGHFRRAFPLIKEGRRKTFC